MPPGPSPLLRALLATVRGAVFAVPLVALILGGELFFPDIFYPHVTWRHFVFRMLVEVMFGLWVVLAWADPHYRPRRSPVLVALSVFVAVIAVADFAGQSPLLSVWSNHERMEGLVGLLHLFAFFVVASSVLDRPRLWRVFFAVSLLVCVVVCADGVRQLVEAELKRRGYDIGRVFLQDVPAWAQGRGYSRADAYIASPVYLGMYLVFHAFLAALLWVRAERAWQRWACAAIAVLSLVVLVGTKTRIAWAGLIVGCGVTAALVALLGGRATRRGAMVALSGTAVLAAAAGLVLLFDPPFVRDLPVLNRLVGEEVASATSCRVALWGIVWQGFLERPLLGWGQDSFIYVFAKHFDPVIYGRDVPSWWDHPHNVFLHWLVSGGALGLLAYLGVLAAAGVVLWKRSGLTTAERSLVTGMLAAYVVFNGAQLDNLTSYVVFFAVLGWLHTLAVARGEALERAPAPRRSVAAVAAALGLAAAGIAVAIWQVNVVNIRPALAIAELPVHLTPQVVGGAVVVNGPAGVQAARRALEARRIGYAEVRETLANQTASVVHSQNDEMVKRVLLDLVVAAMKDLVERDPENARALTSLGVLLSRVPSAEAVRYLERARAISPRRQELCFELGQVYAQLGRAAEASAMFREGWQLRPESDLARLYCAVGAIQAGDRRLEDEVLETMRRSQRGEVFYPPHRVLDALSQQGRSDRVVELLEPVAAEWRQKRQPGHSISRVMRRRLLALQKGYAQSGQPQPALDLLAEMAEVDPDPEFQQRLRAAMDQVRAQQRR